MPEEARPRLQLVAFSNDAPEILGEPDILNDIRAYRDLKLKAFEAHISNWSIFKTISESRSRWRNTKFLRC